MAFCRNCGTEIPDGSTFCSACGKQQNTNAGGTVTPVSPKSRLAALLLCLFLGGIGIHRFYVGKVGTGVIWLLTLGCFGIGTLVDFIMIICGSFTDKAGLIVKNWND